MRALHEERSRGNETVTIYCPGCEVVHVIYVRGLSGAGYRLHGWNHDVDNLTIAPSLLITGGPDPAARCHSYIVNGQWRYLDDCTHRLAGQTVDLPELPATVPS